MAAIKATAVTADKTQRLLIIQWDDGHTSRLPYAGLRANCPCVECKGGHLYMGTPPDLETMRHTPNEGVTIEQIQAVGSYALQFQWSDGHYTGIYTWDYLRQSDPDLFTTDDTD
ncbi:MAG: DUF971 domain-containing protein [Chloroflexi bacterium]|nr:DUF971 domain-containing protein [Ardenticatenaceae bacterium]MBL1129697.1 DUF971 domain-containing protein [Chloroflexota bacterium]NOG35778.1 DUF971 domain-containing protein [Chloroflexota bacterium]GIK58814.1 MAG: hypothetical protein BroJett015_44770 [Chloroflexota bacterium]